MATKSGLARHAAKTVGYFCILISGDAACNLAMPPSVTSVRRTDKCSSFVNLESASIPGSLTRVWSRKRLRKFASSPPDVS